MLVYSYSLCRVCFCDLKQCRCTDNMCIVICYQVIAHHHVMLKVLCSLIGVFPVQMSR